MTINTQPINNQRHYRIGVYVGLTAVLTIGRFWAPAIPWQGSATSFASLELVTAVLSFFIGSLALLNYYTQRSDDILFIATGFLGAGLLGSYHAIFLSQATNLSANAISQSMLISNASRIFLAVMLLGSWLVWQWSSRSRTNNNLIFWAALIAVVGVLLLGLRAAPISSFTVGWVELVASGIFTLMAILGYLLKGAWKHNRFEHTLIIALIIACFGQIQYAFFAATLFDPSFMLAATAKLASNLAVLAGLLLSMLDLFRRDETNARDLTHTNDALQREIMERKRAEKAENEQRQLAEALREVGNALSAMLDFNALLDAILDQIARVVPYGTANIMLVASDGGSVHIASTRGYERHLQRSLPDHFSLDDMPTLQRMMQSGQPLVIPDTAVHPDWIQLSTSTHVRSWAGTPIVLQNETIAFIALNNSRPNFYKLEDAGRLDAFAGQAAIAIANARLYAELQTKVEELTTRNRISEAISATIDLEETLAIVSQQATRLLGVDATSVALHDPVRSDLWFAAASGEASDFVRGKRMKLGQGIVGWVVQHGQPVLIPDVANDPRHFGGFDQQSGFSAQSILCVPLVNQGRTIGAIEAINKASGPFNHDDLQRLSLLASPAAAAIENARLYGQAQTEISERKRAEAALEAERAQLAERVAERTADLQAANVELARAARLKDEFLASMSHELRTPLNAVLGMSEALQEGVYGEMNTQQAQALGSIAESGRHLLALINDILDLSKIEAGRLELELRPVALRSICESSLRLVKQDAHKKRLTVQQQLDEAITDFVADERRLKQILVNLLSNAVKFTPEGGEIGLEVSGNAQTQQIDFVVWDSGIGISEEGLGQLFQPFMQLDSRLSREFGGTGLGLSLVQRLATMHGGSVAVTSAVGDGSRFTVSLPWRTMSSMTAVSLPPPPPKQAAPTSPQPHSHRAQPMVLLAEDNEANIKTLARYLRFRSYEVVVARNGREAITRTQTDHPDIILMDIQMPGMDGLQAIRAIRADAQVGHTPIIALTALAMPGDQQRCLAAGADDYLSKPISLAHLSTTIERHLGHPNGHHSH